MISESKLAANRANALLSRGPTTPEGRARSSQNALKHGMRSARLARFAETSYSFEETRRKWMGIAQPRNDIEEFIISQTAAMACKVQRVQLADAEHAESLVEKADEIELGEIHDIGCCLFFDPCGPTALYGKQSNNWRKKRTSWKGEAIDPYDPKKLVDVLYSSAAGCRWLREQWEELGAHLKKAKGFWRSADKLKAIRMLGRQPIDAPDDVRVAAIFLASYAIRRKGDPFDDLLSDMGSETLAQFVKDVTDRSAADIDVSEATKARQILLDLVAENVAMIDEALEEHQASATKKGEKSADRLGFDESPRSKGIQQYEARCVSGFFRGLEVYRKWQKHQGGRRNAEREPTRDPEPSRPPDYGRATRAESERKGGGQAEGMRDEGRGMRADRGPAGTERVGALDASGFRGMAAERGAGAAGTILVEPAELDAAPASAELADSCPRAEVDHEGPAGFAGGTTLEEGVETDDAVGDETAPEWAEGFEGSLATRGLDPAGDKGTVTKNEQNVTNEPNFDEDVINIQTPEIVEVAANSGDCPGLDTVRTNPTREWVREEGEILKSRPDGADSRGKREVWRERWEREQLEQNRRVIAKLEKLCPDITPVTTLLKDMLAGSTDADALLRPVLPRSP